MLDLLYMLQKKDIFGFFFIIIFINSKVLDCIFLHVLGKRIMVKSSSNMVK